MDILAGECLQSPRDGGVVPARPRNGELRLKGCIRMEKDVTTPLKPGTGIFERDRLDSNASLSSIASTRTQASNNSNECPRRAQRNKAEDKDADDGIDPVKAAIEEYYNSEEVVRKYIRDAQEKRKNFNQTTVGEIIDMLAQLNESFTFLACEASKARTAEQPPTPQTPLFGTDYAATPKAPLPPRPRRQRSKVPEKRFTAFVKPATEAGTSTPAETKKAFMAAFDPRSSKLRVKSVRTTRDGLAVDVASQADLDKITSLNNLTDKGLTVSIAELRKPKVIVYDVDKDMSNADFVDMLYEQNEELFARMQKKDMANGITFRFKSQPGQDRETTNWVIEVSQPSGIFLLLRAGCASVTQVVE
ncbi:hypothetical protein QAD02_010457 [Eretmocerus hayati]|uniref:Uncharacterized protein n=1 Tax=Eretmocerus hayati TaxID=131215 RepID=A0ACC2NV71_9HYME|nr:hypothetical protein QAD02_010457 [Eretmocerus hayati]